MTRAGISSLLRNPRIILALLPTALLLFADLLPYTTAIASRASNRDLTETSIAPRRRSPRQQAAVSAPSIVLAPIAQPLIEPTGLDYHPNSNQILVAMRRAPSEAYQLGLIAPDGQQQRFSTFSAATGRVRFAVARERLGNITPGEVFLSAAPATITRIAADGSSIIDSWARLQGESGSITSLCLADAGAFKGYLVAATETGHVWMIDDSGNASLIADIATPVAGLLAVPDDSARYGDWAGKLLVGARMIGGLYAVDSSGKVDYFNLPVYPQDIKLIAANQTLFGIDAKSGTLWRAPAEQFAPYAGDVLIAQETPGFLARARWSGKQFVIEKLAEASPQWQQIAFAPDCATSVSPTSAFYGVQGNEGELAVTAPPACNWTAVSNQAWLEITSSAGGTGNGSIAYLVRDNFTGSARQGTITVNGVVFTLTQDAGLGDDCQYLLTPTSISTRAAGDTGTLMVLSDERCAWQATTTDSFIVITSGCCGIGNGSVSYTVKPNPGSGRSGKIMVAGKTFTVKQKANQPPLVNAGPDQTITLPNTATLSGSLIDDNAPVAAVVSWSQLSGPATAILSSASNTASGAIFSTAGTYVMRLSASDTVYTSSDDVVITVNPDPAPLPPDPATVAPAINPSVVTTIGAATQFLYTGPNPIQTGVAAGTIKMERAAVLRGRVVNLNGTPLPRVKISVLDHPELGQTLSRADGRFDLAVNGGGLLTVQYEKAGFITSQRKMEVQWQNYETYPDVALMGYDPQVTHIDLSASLPVQVAQGSTMSDSDGPRRSVLMFKQGTTATMVLTNNSTQPLVNLHVRATEFTVGDMGDEAMPGDLPAISGYTYAVEFSVDEAVAVNAKSVVFNQPVINYLENFLDFPVGASVPSGVYDRENGIWMPSASGQVVKLLAINGGVADLDLDGSGQPADDNGYAALGIAVAERQTLATLYVAGQVLWRVPINHFSPQDLNWSGPPDDATRNEQRASCDKERNCNDTVPNRSIIECQSQTLGESIPLVGTSFTLNYRSDRVPGRVSAYTLTIPVSGPSIPDTLKRIEMEILVAGRVFKQTFSNTPNQTTTFTWDGKDAYGRTLQGKQIATVRVGYVYDTFVRATPGFGAFGDFSTNFGGGRREAILWQVQRIPIGTVDLRGPGLGGWSLDVHHVYDPNGQTVYMGNGAQRNIGSVSSIISTFAGGGMPPDGLGDGLPATEAQLNQPEGGIVAAADGTLYIADSLHHRIRKVGTNGIIATVAGTGSAGYNGDGIQATTAQLNHPGGLTLGADGSLFIADTLNHRVRKVAPGGIITTVAGTGDSSYTGDGGPATQAQLSSPRALAIGPDGNLFLVDSGNLAVRRVAPDGIITTILEGPPPAKPAGKSPTISTPPTAVSVGLDGLLYVADFFSISRINADLSETVIAGGGTPPDGLGDGMPATQASIIPSGFAFAPDGTLYIAEGFESQTRGRIRAVGPDAIMRTIAGRGNFAFGGDGGPAPQADFNRPADLARGPDGSIYVVDTFNHRIRKITLPLPGFSATDIAIASEDGSELYQFSSVGRHLRTINTPTGATLHTFTYDSAGHLTQITDGDSNVTTIQRNAGGDPTAIVAPFGQSTALTRDANGFLNNITDPASQTYQLSYTAAGLLTSLTNPRGNASIVMYDGLGRLIKDTDAATGFEALARTDQSQDYTVVRNTALNRTTNYQVQTLATSDEKDIITDPAGLQTQSLRRPSGVSTTTYPDGMIDAVTQSGDPRWGIQAPLTVSETTSTPGGLNFNATFGRMVTLSSPGDLLSLATQTDTLNVNGQTYMSLFTGATRTFTNTTPANRQLTTVIDLQGRTTQQQFANLNAANYTYDTRGRLSIATFGGGAEMRSFNYSHNANGFLASITNPLTQATSFSYDAAGRVTQQTLSDSRVIGLGYDGNGNLISVTPPGRPAHSLAYTTVDLLSTYTPPTVTGTGPTQYAYNLDRQLTTITRPDSLTLNYGYDSAGRLIALTVPSGQYSYAHSATTGNITSVTAPGGGALAYVYDGMLLTRTTWSGTVAGNVSRAFDNNFRLTSQSINDANAINFAYDNDSFITSAGSLTLTRHAQNGLITGSMLSNVTDTRSYNNFGEVAGFSALFNATGLYAVTYTRDKLRRITQKSETIGGVTSVYDYSYDLTSRLTQVKKDNVTISTYTYDSNDNRLSYTGPGGSINGTYDNQDRLTAYGTATYSYTANGELSTKTTGAQTTTYGYDVLGNLRNVTLPDGTDIEYVIDGQNRRIGKRVNGALVQGWLYQDQLKPIAELDGSNNLVSRFVYGSRVNVPDYMSKGGATYRLITDHLGSVRLVVNVETGAIAQRLDYDEFGVVTLDTAPGFQPFGFAGGLHDQHTKLVRFGLRDYDAEIGKWTAKDPILFAGGDVNLYEYVANNPINVTDPWGASGVDTSQIIQIDPNNEAPMGGYSPTPDLSPPKFPTLEGIRSIPKPKPEFPTMQEIRRIPKPKRKKTPCPDTNTIAKRAAERFSDHMLEGLMEDMKTRDYREMFDYVFPEGIRFLR